VYPRFEPLTPTSIIARSAVVFADRIAVVDGARRFTYAEFGDRVGRLAGALCEIGVNPGDRVAVLTPNTHIALEATLGVPQSGAVLVMLNTRLSAQEIAGILAHAEPAVLIVQTELVDLAGRACALLADPPRVITAKEYESLLAVASPYAHEVRDEGSPIALNYTSGTTGNPKGAIYHHRGAFLQALSMAYHAGLGPNSVYLWTLPMFHCNGWCFPWAVTAAGATHVCLPKVDAAEIWSLVHSEGVTHCCAAPTVLNSITGHPTATPAQGGLRIATGGAPPSPALIERATALNIDILHLYGLTETFGPSLICQPQPLWEGLPAAQTARHKARQGVPTLVSGRVRVIDANGMDVPPDGQAIGEIAIRGNTVMSGYYRDATQTSQAIPEGWLVTGDLAVQHPDRYVEIRDRSKDVIISGGENIASVEVEQALAAHPAVSEAAVVACPHPRWGEVPVAYVHLREDTSVSEKDLIEHVRGLLAHFKAPKKIIFGELPHTATGKVQKFKLRAGTSSTLFESEDGS